MLRAPPAAPALVAGFERGGRLLGLFHALQALPQSIHQVNDRPLLALWRADDLFALDLGRDQLAHLGVVGIGVALDVEPFFGRSFDQLGGQPQLFFAYGRQAYVLQDGLRLAIAPA